MTLLVAILMATIYPADYGAIPDAFTATCSTVESSADISVDGHSFTSADIGKVALVFGVGAITTDTNRQDLIATVSAVSGSTITLSSAATITTNSVRITVGTQNQPAFQAAINSCASTNDVIALTNGTYLVVPPTQITGVGGGAPALRIQRGGIQFLGQGATNTTILGCGAWRVMNGAAHRGELFWIQGPITNDYPLSFESLTFDGGVAPGNTSGHGFPASATTGGGWDESHNAIKLAGGGLKQHSLKVFRNCAVTRWRGEMFIDNAGWTNCFTDVDHCNFYDGNASALNLAGAYHIDGVVVTNVYLSMEYYSGYANADGIMENSDFSSNVVLLGAIYGHHQPLFLIRSNEFRGWIQCGPAANIVVIHNRFSGIPWGITTTSAGYQGTDYNHDWIIASNVFNVNTAISLNGGGGARIERALIIGNSGNTRIVDGFGEAKDVVLRNNTCNYHMMECATITGQWPLDDGSNVSPAFVDSWTQTGVITVANGAFHHTDGFFNTVWKLDDISPGRIPLGARLTIDGNTSPWVWASATNYPNCYSARIPIGGRLTFVWTGSAWQPADRIDATQVTVGTLRGQ